MKSEDLNLLLSIAAQYVAVGMMRSLSAHPEYLPTTDTGELSDPYGPTPQQMEISQKAVEKYLAAQKRQWKRFNEAMFTPKELVRENKKTREKERANVAKSPYTGRSPYQRKP